MLDLPVSKFRRLVEVGALPPPIYIGDEERWRVEDIKAIVDGKAARPPEEFEV